MTIAATLPDEDEKVISERSGKNVLITGGAGFLGINLIRHLLEQGYNVRSVDIADFDYPEHDVVDVKNVDISNITTLREAMKGVDIVVHTAAALPLYSEMEIHMTDVVGTRNVLDAAMSQGVSRIVHISSTAVYGIPDHHPLREDDKLNGVGPYGIAKIAAENICQEYRNRGLCVSIIRPKSFVGPERLGVFALLYDWAADGRGFPMIGSGNNRYQLLDVEDLCQAIRLCMTLPEDVVNDTFNIGAREFTTMKEDYQAVLDQAGFGKRVKRTPAPLVVWTLRALERLNVSPLYKWVYETASKDSFVSIEKAEQVLGYNPKYSNKDALLRNFNWYRENRDRFAGAAGKTHRMPWKQGAIGLFKRFF